MDVARGICVCIDLLFSIYIKNHEFTPVPLIPVQYHRVHPVFFPFKIGIPFLTVKNLASVNVFTHLINSPVYNQLPIAVAHLHRYDSLSPSLLGVPFLTLSYLGHPALVMPIPLWIASVFFFFFFF